jgi:acyl-CoA thioester hydrolase
VKHEVRIIFGDTDQMGVVYYANYLRFFESSRAALLRSFGRNHKDLDAWEVALPVVEAQCRYRSPAYYEDLLEVEVFTDDVRGASVRFVYTVRRGDDLIAEGFTRHAAIGPGGKPRRWPEPLRELLVAAQRTQS